MNKEQLDLVVLKHTPWLYFHRWESLHGCYQWWCWLLPLKFRRQRLIEKITQPRKLTKAKYDTHVEQGFTPEQALEICKGDL